MVRHWAISVLRQYCRIYYTTVVVNFARFSENSAKMGPGVVIYLHIIMTHDDKFADRFIGQPAIRGGLSGVP